MLATMSENTAMFVRAYPPAIFGRMANSLAVLYKGTEDYAALRNIAWVETSAYSWNMKKGRASSSNPIAWQPFEWVDPILTLGVEFRTTERYKGKPVYIKAVSLGAAPGANAAKTVAHGISDVAEVVDYGGNMSRDTGSISLPGMDNNGAHQYLLAANNAYIIWKNPIALEGYTGEAWIKVTKTTD